MLGNERGQDSHLSSSLKQVGSQEKTKVAASVGDTGLSLEEDTSGGGRRGDMRRLEKGPGGGGGT